MFHSDNPFNPFIEFKNRMMMKKKESMNKESEGKADRENLIKEEKGRKISARSLET